MRSTCANEQEYIITAVKWKIGWLQQPVTAWLIYSFFFHVGQLSKSSQRSTAETRASNGFPSRRTRSCFSSSLSAGSRNVIRKTGWDWERWDEASTCCERNYLVFTECLLDRNQVKLHNDTICHCIWLSKWNPLQRLQFLFELWIVRTTSAQTAKHQSQTSSTLEVVQLWEWSVSYWSS